MTQIVECVRCGRTKPNCGRGLCTTCYESARIGGYLEDYPAKQPKRPLTEVIEDYQFIARSGTTRAEAAQRLGMSREALDKALQRAKKAGLLEEVST